LSEVLLYKHSGILEFLPQRKWESFTFGELKITPVPLIHSKPTFGYVFELADECIAYLTDTKGLPSSTEAFLADGQPDLIVIDCCFVPGSTQKGHNNLNDILQIDQRVQPKRTVLTHIGHDMDIWLKRHHSQLPSRIIAGYDGMTAFPDNDVG